jgi:hypothetical protein
VALLIAYYKEKFPQRPPFKEFKKVNHPEFISDLLKAAPTSQKLRFYINNAKKQARE